MAWLGEVFALEPQPTGVQLVYKACGNRERAMTFFWLRQAANISLNYCAMLGHFRRCLTFSGGLTREQAGLFSLHSCKRRGLWLFNCMAAWFHKAVSLDDASKEWKPACRPSINTGGRFEPMRTNPSFGLRADMLLAILRANSDFGPKCAFYDSPHRGLRCAICAAGFAFSVCGPVLDKVGHL